ncbi:Rho-binding antiterminator [Klebsiella pneumoniae]|uniref:Rho-binding antiterminator n=1 Tax=Klebsiella pneumoniae TaxID=573 RepID=A0A939NS83_KLEPN|nr:Rho-binding antiterminator [Klebsiella pneumoniae]
MNDTYQPINCDDYDNLSWPASITVLTLALKDGEQLQAKASDLISRKISSIWWSNSPATSASCADKIASFSHPEIGTVVVSES